MAENHDLPKLPKVTVDGCPDCASVVSASLARSGVSAGPVLVVQVEHHATCPWFAAVSPDADETSHAPTPDRLIRHVRAVR